MSNNMKIYSNEEILKIIKFNSFIICTEMYSSDSHLLDVGIRDVINGTDLFLNNKLTDTRNLFLSRHDGSISSYHCASKALYTFLEAIIAFSPDIIKSAIEEVEDCLKVCNKFRKKNDIILALNRLVNKVNYNAYTPKEVHAELCYAEILLVRGLLSFIEDESTLGFVQGAVKIRNSVNIYNDCHVILETRDWTNDSHKVHFESGVLIGVGSFNLLISLLPKRTRKILEFIGFSGNLEIGMEYLLKSLTLDSARKILGELMLLLYNVHVLTSISDDEGNLDLVENIIDSNLKQHPNSFLFLYFQGRLELCRGDFLKSSQLYEISWRVQDEWPEFHNIIFWEMFWIKCFLMDWDEADTFITYLLERSGWSPSVYAFGKACVLSMKENLTSDELMTVNKLMNDVPKLKVRIGGKSMAAEKFVIKQTEKYFDQNHLLTLPIFQLMFLWNKFTLLRHNVDNTQKIYNVIENTFDALEESSEKYFIDDKSLLLLLKGSVLRQMKRYEEAIECLEEVVSYEKEIVSENHLVPFAKVELAFIYKNQHQNANAISLLESAEKYKNYSLESRLNFKIHIALMKLKKISISSSDAPFSFFQSTSESTKSTSILTPQLKKKKKFCKRSSKNKK